jgi:uncharacterized protein YbjT (DUF2867 family)
VIIVDKTRKGVLVIGGNGHQGAAAVRYLQQRDVPVHAVARDLADDAASLSGLLGDAEALLMFFDDASAGPAERLRQGKAIGEAARRAGVDHVVLSAASAAHTPRRSSPRRSQGRRPSGSCPAPTSANARQTNAA